MLAKSSLVHWCLLGQ